MGQPEVDNQTIQTMYYLGGVMFAGVVTIATVGWNYFKKREKLHSEQVSQFVENTNKGIELSTKMLDLMARVEEHMRYDMLHRAAQSGTRDAG